MSYRAVLFDLDGTLVNTLEDIASAMNYALERYGLPAWQVADYRYLVGNGARKLAERAVRDRADMKEMVLNAYQHQYETHCMALSAPYPGIPRLLQSLSRRGLRLCVFSNKPDADTCRIIQHYFPGPVFQAVHGQREGIPVKPDPQGALEMAGELGISPGEFLYLGDTGTDMICANRAGMTAIGVLWGFRDRAELEENGARFCLEKPEDLIKLLS